MMPPTWESVVDRRQRRRRLGGLRDGQGDVGGHAGHPVGQDEEHVLARGRDVGCRRGSAGDIRGAGGRAVEHD